MIDYFKPAELGGLGIRSLETDRLVLRPFELSDAKVVEQLAGDREIARTTLNIPHPFPDGAAAAWINAIHAAADQGKQYGFAVVRTSDQTLLGAINIGIQSSHRRAEIAYWNGRPFWGHGYATEGAAKVVQFGFEELNLNRIFAFAFHNNPASSRVIQKIGMKHEGTKREHVLKWSEYLVGLRYLL